MTTIKPIILKILSLLLTVFLVCFFIFVAGCSYVHNCFKIDVLDSIESVSKLSAPFNEKSLYHNVYTKSDIESVKRETDLSLNGLILQNNSNYYINNQLSTQMQADISLTDKQISALADLLIASKNDFIVDVNSKQINLKDYNVRIRQITLSNVTINSVDLNAVIKCDIKNAKMGFPSTLVKLFIPSQVYYSVTVKVIKTDDGFGYTTKYLDHALNYLNEEQTNNLLKLVNFIAKTGKAENFANTIGKSIVDLILGSEENNGLAYSLKDLGATSINFASTGVTKYIVIKK